MSHRESLSVTVQTIKNAKPTTKTRKLFDGGGLYTEVSPKGRKWWRLKYRFAAKKKLVLKGAFSCNCANGGGSMAMQISKNLDLPIMGGFRMNARLTMLTRAGAGEYR